MKKLPKVLKYLVWPGLALVTAGLVVGLLNGWTLVAVALLVAGALLIVATLASYDFSASRASKDRLEDRSAVRFWQSRSTQSGTNAVVSVLSVLVILGIVNFLGARYDSRTDLTEGQLLTLSPSSQAVVKSLEQPTEALVFSQAPNPVDQKLLENYHRLNPDFTYRYVDPFAEPQLARELGVETGSEIYLRTGKGLKEGKSDRDLLVQRLGPQEPLTERQITNKLAQLSQTNIAVVYFLQGHEEYAIDNSKAGFFEAASRLKDENYTVEALNLANTGTVPPDADVLIVAGAKKALFNNEVVAVRNYLESGGSVFVMVDPQVKTGLETLLSQWGVVPEDALVIDTSGGGQLVGLGPAAPLVTDYGDHPITQAFGNGRSFFPVVRPLQIREVSNITETPLLFTAQNSHAQPVTEGDDIAVDPNKAPEGPFAIGVALSRPAVVTDSGQLETEKPTSGKDSSIPDSADGIHPNADKTTADETNAGEITANGSDLPTAESRMVVIGTSSFATDGLFNQQLNGDVFLNSVNWLSKVDNPTLSIRPKEATNRRFNLTVMQQILLMLLSLVVFPLVGLIGAGVLWARRR